MTALSIQRKLMLLVGLTATLAVSVAGGALVVIEIKDYRMAIVTEIEALADVMSADSTASLAFGNQKAAEGVLASLARRPHIVGASILTRDGTAFAAYGDERQIAKRPPETPGYRFDNRRIIVVRPLGIDGDHLGDLRLVGDLEGVRARLAQYIVTLLFVLVGALVPALLVGGRMQRGVAEPILAELRRRLSDLQTEMTERKRAEETLQERDQQLQQAQKMEAVGRLAGGVAHDFNNLLTAIQGYGEMAAEASADPTIKSHIHEVLTAANRAAGLTSQLLAFSRKQILSPKPVDLSAVVRENEKMLRRLIREDVELEMHLGPSPTRILMDPGQLGQVLMNLCVNASDAMPDGGTLTIESSDVHLDDAYTALHREVATGDYVMLSVTDTGTGMDEATQARIFEPFFTTKGVGKGTGLGLATVYGIVRQSGGHIWVYSEPNKGTTFRVYLPAIAADAKSAGAADQTKPDVKGGHETVLLVEDEPQVRKLAAMTLRAKGYDVLEAPHGDAALEVSRQHGGGIDLLVTDVIMPKMNGRELVERIKTQRPDLRVLFMSGYTDTAIVRQGVLEPGVQLLQKPFSSVDLTRRVREMLTLA